MMEIILLVDFLQETDPRSTKLQKWLTNSERKGKITVSQ